MHAFNRIPVNASKFIVSFELHLPRQFALRGRGRLARYMAARIAAPRCRRIIALSHFAKRCLLAQHADSPIRQLLSDKLLVRHPNIDSTGDGRSAGGGPGRATHRHVRRRSFRAEGRLRGGEDRREIAAEQGLPIQANVVSVYRSAAPFGPIR